MIYTVTHSVRIEAFNELEAEETYLENWRMGYYDEAGVDLEIDSTSLTHATASDVKLIQSDH